MIFITADTVAGLIGFETAASFLKNRYRLEQHQGFPVPLPTSQRPLKWRRDAVENWAANQGQASADVFSYEQAAAAGPNILLMKKAAARAQEADPR